MVVSSQCPSTLLAVVGVVCPHPWFNLMDRGDESVLGLSWFGCARVSLSFAEPWSPKHFPVLSVSWEGPKWNTIGYFSPLFALLSPPFPWIGFPGSGDGVEW